MCKAASFVRGEPLGGSPEPGQHAETTLQGLSCPGAVRVCPWHVTRVLVAAEAARGAQGRWEAAQAGDPRVLRLPVPGAWAAVSPGHEGQDCQLQPGAVLGAQPPSQLLGDLTASCFSLRLKDWCR